jgi:uncharacterized protein (TIGR02646 family)
MVPLVTVGPQYSAAALPRRHTPPPATFSAYRDCLRLEFEFTCAYCLSTEREAAEGEEYGGFEIEHFKPKGRDEFRKLRHVYSNLLWSCHACNRAKRDKWPSKKERALGYRFVDPSKEALGHSLTLQGAQVQAVNASAAGTYMIDEIRLNSPVHVGRRQRRAKRATQLAKLEMTAQVLRARILQGRPDTATITVQLDTLDKEILDLGASFDRHAPVTPPPTSCLCPPSVHPAAALPAAPQPAAPPATSPPAAPPPAVPPAIP